ncbi:hypothetical protein SPRG_11070 [Saprolegnia parasitica CBS 223.65]|uniref:Uncharacterized protein n=1 Tax=Saprolegnia parasitica (strain CBS 223.65) TaxID=695850 RepID=A0A067BYM8_SAPPC|nr:hypothetical protein SPRG_11070 [Saprolegnia parasitica CBS 223.65]KDO23624.1 hypothetical protein SPRG_11070 [Saprolegnia parasitica CBS 223.65]|eukprot:XP_012205607.1 hypothetical protein SPRG_11070 [Saprolegnia parasitica CBS 223.65]
MSCYWVASELVTFALLERCRVIFSPHIVPVIREALRHGIVDDTGKDMLLDCAMISLPAYYCNFDTHRCTYY